MGRLDKSDTVSESEIGSYLARSINLFAAGKMDEATKLRDHARFLMRRHGPIIESSSETVLQNDAPSTDSVRATAHH